MMEEHKRRKRYSGTHPKTFAEKYKEHDPEKYADTVARVIGKGSTPAGMHLSIMAEEVLQALRIQPGDIGLDATLGYGGHARRMLEHLQGGDIFMDWMWIPLKLSGPGSACKKRGMAKRFSRQSRKILPGLTVSPGNMVLFSS